MEKKDRKDRVVLIRSPLGAMENYLARLSNNLTVDTLGKPLLMNLISMLLEKKRHPFQNLMEYELFFFKIGFLPKCWKKLKIRTCVSSIPSTT